ncbi:MAG TPA: glycosyltransferase family 2 protein, partial [Allosphingosinicella sp.]
MSKGPPTPTGPGPSVFQPRAIVSTRSGDGDASAPACSVVMTVYNDRRFVREAVDSLLRQDFEDFELIIVDDCCDDPDFVAGLAALDSRIRVLRNVQNVGTAVSANRGIDAARAAIIARLDSDDVAEPARIGRLVEALRADPELGLVGSAVTYIDEG